jgi:malate dehydrogenase
MTKLGIVGAAGSVGSAMAFVLGLAGLFDELALTDAKKNLLESQAIDLADCLGAASDVTVVGGDFEALAGSDVVIMTASVTTRQVSSRSEYLAANLQLAKTMASRLAKVCPEAFLINATSPVDVLVMVLREALGWDRHRIMGFSANDSLLFRRAAAKVLGVSPTRVGGIVIGEYGETQVPLFSTLTLDGEKVSLSRSQETAVEKSLSDWYPRWQALDSGRSSAWTSSLSMLRTMEALLGKKAKGPSDLINRPFALTGSVLVEGEYGLSGVSLGLPLTPGQGGWGSIIELDLLQSERARLKQSALMIKSQYQMTL